jgi:hypothetical protein
LPPEWVRRDRDESLGCQLIAGLADVGVDTKQLLNDWHLGRRFMFSKLIPTLQVEGYAVRALSEGLRLEF